MLRGGEALVFPLQSRYLQLNYFKNTQDFDINLSDDKTSELELIIWSVFERALKKLQLKRSNLKGLLELDSKILFGAGMGASATLCVALTHFFSYLGFLKEDEKYEFARELENLFHGESSGVDIAVTLRNQPLLFSRLQGYVTLQSAQKPLLFLSHTGARGVTKDCVDLVKKLFVNNRDEAERIDEKMKHSVRLFQELLTKASVDHVGWIQALEESYSCFLDWGLVNEPVKRHELALRQAGAAAVKLTGSGSGGFMLSYWKAPPIDVTFELIPCFTDS